MFACGVAVRAALALPIEHRANWIFQVTEDQRHAPGTDACGGSRGDGLRHRRAAHGRGAVVVDGARAERTGSAGIVVAAIGLVFVHAVLLDWRRIPFTCSYLPGKRFIGHSALIGVAACLLFTVIASGFVRTALISANQGIVIAGALLVIGYWLQGASPRDLDEDATDVRRRVSGPAASAPVIGSERKPKAHVCSD